MPTSSRQARFVRFGLFEADLGGRELRREGLKVKLQDRPFEVLAILLERPGEVIEREEFRKRLWPADTFVAFDPSLNTSINKLRLALSDDAENPRFIATVGRRGYRFIAPTTSENGAGPSAPTETVRPSSADTENPLLRAFAVVFLAALFVGGYFVWRHYRSLASAPAPRVMLAVLPFQNLTGDPEQDYFADGVTEEITTRLGQLPAEQLGVIARSSAMPYKRTDKRLDQIGRELSVQYVLEGSFRRSADRVRITAQLIRVNDQSHLWAQDYDRSLKDVLTVQDDVAASVAREIQLRLTPQQLSAIAHTRAVDPQGLEEYLKGRYFWNKRTEDGFRKAIEHFDAAIARDPNYAEAYAGLADSYVLLGGYGLMPQNEAMPKGKAADLKALSIDDRLADAYTSLGLISEQYDWNWPEAERSFKRAIELNPNYSVAHHYYGDAYLPLVRRDDAAIAELRIAHELDPLSLIIQVDLAKRLYYVGKRDESLEEFKKVLEVDPSFVQAHLDLAECYATGASYSQAIAEIEKIQPLDSHPEAYAWRGYLYGVTGHRDEAMRVMDDLQRSSQRRNIDPGHIALIYTALGEKDLALLWLGKVVDERSPYVLGLQSWSIFAPLRSDPRFSALVRRVGLP
jgi:TolB-like protein/DNA-binding winged helix-turn-helix (wHTH) protein/Tfp pilus assembly protein PilF